ncbi:MAG: hypothetical protein G01um101419_125 [Parcubacteria group bacterium Gr01-1014_19]|nr:MAG: hypothetical protein G01um101419_125 [Parcubacteria group bacterium Gr01-1014_19]
MSKNRPVREKFSWNIITKKRVYGKTIYEIFPDELDQYVKLCESESGLATLPYMPGLEFDANFMLCVNKAANYCEDFPEKVVAFRRMTKVSKDMVMGVIFYAKKKAR